MNRVMRAGIGLGLAIGAAVCLGQTSHAPQSQRQTALALEQQDRNAEAEEDWRAILKAHPSDPEAYAHLGLLEARQEHYKEAVPFYRKAMALGPAVPGLRLNLGLALFKGGELKQAILEFTPLLKSQPPNSPEAQRLSILMGMAHYGLAEYAEAAPYLKQAAADDPSNLPLRLALAHSCLWSKQYQCVLDTYHKILALNSESAEADMLAGEAQDELRNSAGAIEQFRAAVKADPKEPNVHFGLGFLLWRLMQLEEAAQEFQAELVNNPDHGQALAYLADTEMKLGHPEAAPPPLEMATQPLLEKSLRINPGLELVHLDLGILYVDAGRHDDALRELKEAARLAPEDVNVHWRLGRLYRSMGRKDEAKAEFEKASQVNKAEDQALFDRINSEHARPSQAQPPPEAPAK